VIKEDWAKYANDMVFTLRLKNTLVVDLSAMKRVFIGNLSLIQKTRLFLPSAKKYRSDWREENRWQ
jgi:hypothetical protein